MSPTKHIAKGTFGHNVLTLAGGTLAGQLILFISLPFLQRYFYGPESFGILTVYISLSELLITMAGLKYEFGIVRIKKEADAFNLMLVSFICVMGVSLLSFIVFVGWLIFFPEQGQAKELGYYLLIIPFSVLFFGAANTLSYWFNREKKYRQISGGKMASSLTSEPIKFAWAALLTGNGMGLIIGRVIGQVAAFIYSITNFLKTDKNKLRLGSWQRVKKLAVSQKSYPLYVLPGILINVLVTAIYVQFFNAHYGKENVGYLGVSVGYIGVAFGIISGAVGQVFFRRISDIHDYGKLKKLYIKFTGLLSLPALAAVLAVYIIPSSFVTAILGEKWEEIMPVSRIMVTWMAIAFVSSSLSFMHIRLDTQKKLLGIDTIHLILVFTALYGGYAYYGTFKAVLICFSIAQAIHYILAIFAALYFLNKRSKSQQLQHTK